MKRDHDISKKISLFFKDIEHEARPDYLHNSFFS